MQKNIKQQNAPKSPRHCEQRRSKGDIGAGEVIDEGFQEGDHVIVDKASINEQHGTISFFFGNGFCEIYTDYGDRLPVHIIRLSRNS